MSCSSCDYLNEGKESKGKVSGACYFCIKNKKYVNGSNSSCKDYKMTVSRKNYICDKIYNEDLRYNNDDKPVSFYLVILIIIVIIGLILTYVSN